MDTKNFYTFNEYMKRKEKLTASEEDYIEMIYRLCIENKYTRVGDLATALNVKPPSVSSMLKRLVEKEFIKHQEYGIIELNKFGYELGKTLYERHHTIESFLKLIYVEDNLLEEVEKMEHTLSDETVSSLKNLVDFFTENSNILKEYYKYCDR